MDELNPTGPEEHAPRASAGSALESSTPADGSRRHRLTIPRRISIGFGLMLVLFAIVATVSVMRHQRTAARLRLLHQGYLPLALTVGEARATQSVFRTLLDRLLEERDPTATKSWVGAALRVRPARLGVAMEGLEAAKRNATSDDDNEALDEVESLLRPVASEYEALDARYDTLFEAVERDDTDTAATLLEEIRRSELAIERKFRRCFQRLQARIATTSESAEVEARFAAILLGVLVLLTLLIGAMVTWWAQRVLRPLPLLHERVAAVARGDLSSRLEPKSDDELGQLTTEFERMVDAIATRDASLRDAAQAQIKLERMQRQIVEGLRAAIVVVGSGGHIKSANSAAGNLLELQDGDIDRPLAKTRLSQALPGLSGRVAEVQAYAKAQTMMGATFSGSERDRLVNILVSPFDALEGGGSALVVAEDVTVEHQTKAKLIQSERLAAIGRMAAHVTHEVRNPLSSIRLNLEMLEEEMAVGPESRAMLRDIHKEIDRLTEITREYLRLARLPEPHLELDDLAELMRAVVSFVDMEFEAEGVTLDVSIGELPQIAMDEGQLRQALLNLLRNAREAMGEEAGVVAITAQPSRGGVLIELSDEGEGIAPDERERIFDLFYTTKSGGSGLGLPLTQQIVVAHSGQIECVSVLGEGTTFRIWLPASDAAPRPSGETADHSSDSGRAESKSADTKKAGTTRSEYDET